MPIKINGSGDLKKHLAGVTKKVEEKIKANTKLAEDKAPKEAHLFLEKKAKENGLDPATMTEQDLEDLKRKYGSELKRIAVEALKTSF
jgi:translation initiation factor 2 alpha subunit (eIF-2alpha)